MIAVGGGGGGTNGHQSGGAGGYEKCATFQVPSQVPSCTRVPVIVGGGGQGAKRRHNNVIVDCRPGEPSSFGTYLLAPGGGACNFLKGNAGGTGSGAPCWKDARTARRCEPGSRGGAGGSGGSNGGSASREPGGAGQGEEYRRCLQMAKIDDLTPGAGGDGAEARCQTYSTGGGYGYAGRGRETQCWAAGGGGGGVLVNGQGRSAHDGVSHLNFQYINMMLLYQYINGVFMIQCIC